jgi:rhamnosyltransferase subunit B
MRFLLMPFGSHGDVLPLLGIARELMARGQRVKLLINPAFTALAEQAGLDYRSLGQLQDYQRAVADPATASRYGSLQAVAKILATHLELGVNVLEEEIADEPSILVGTSLAFPVRLVAELYHLPCATVHLQPSIIRSCLNPPVLGWGAMPSPRPGWTWLLQWLWKALDWCLLDPAFARPLNQLRQRHNLPPVRSILGDWLHQSSLVLAMFPDWWAQPPADWPRHLQLCHFPLYDGQEQALDLKDTVVFTAGTAFACVPQFYQEAVRLCQRFGCKGLLLTPHRANLPESLPDHLQWRAYLPLSGSLASALAIVHHGGIGTISAALRAGIPQVVCPLAHDQFDNAHRLQSLGLTPSGRLAHRLEQVLFEPRWREKSVHTSQLRGWGQGLSLAARALEQLLDPPKQNSWVNGHLA